MNARKNKNNADQKSVKEKIVFKEFFGKTKPKFYFSHKYMFYIKGSSWA